MADVLDPRNPAPTQGIPRPPALKALTSLRFFAALHVALYHMVVPYALWWGPLAAIFGAGHTGVSLFFFLSGFILTYSHAAEYEQGRGDARRFWVARFARIYPVYLLSMLVVTGGAFLHPHDHLTAYLADIFSNHPKYHVLAYLADLLLVQAWSVRMVNFFNVVAWSVSVEAFFYLLFPFLILRLRPATRGKALLSIGGFWLLAMATPVFCWIHYPQAAATDVGLGMSLIFRVERSPIFALPEFLSGLMLGWLYLRFRPSKSLAAVLAPAGIVASLVVLSLSRHIPPVLLHDGLCIPLYCMVLLGLCERNWTSRLLSAAPLVLLGEASYALYLFHFMFNDWTKAHGAGSSIAAAMWKLAIIIPVTLVIHLVVERPARKRIMQWWNRRHPVSPTHGLRRKPAMPGAASAG